MADPTQDVADALVQSASQADAGTSDGQSERVSTAQSSVDPSQVDRARQAIAKVGTAGAAGERQMRAAADSMQGTKQRFADQSQANLNEEQGVVDEYAKPASAELGKRQKEYDQAVAQREKYRVQVQNQIDAMDQAAKKMATEHVTDYWADKSTGSKITYVLGAILGGAAQSFYGDRTNPVVEMVDKAVQRDLMMQRLRMEKRKEDYGNQNLLLGKMMEHADHTQHAQDMAYVTAINGVKARLEASKQLLSTPEARQKVDAAIANFEMLTAKTQSDIAANTVGKEQRMAMGEAELETKLVEATKTQSATSQMRAETARKNADLREREFAAQEGHTEAALTIPGWHSIDPNVGFTGKAADAEKLRQAHSAVKAGIERMSALAEDLKKGTVSNLTSLDNWQKLQADQAAVVEAAKGAGFADAGKNFSINEEELINKGYMTKNGALINPKGAIRLLKMKQMQVWHELEMKMKDHNQAANE